jgi:putative Holliday junction resolvase
MVPIRTWDERLTTVSAAKALRSGGTKAAQQRGKIDAAAAAILLQGYLDSLTL